jgi:thiol-disulfide isomerase/thioredoxin
MKNLKPILFLLAMLAMQISFAQSTSQLKLSNPYPEKGEKLSFTYDPAGTVLAAVPGKVEATVNFVEATGYPNTPVVLQADGKIYKGEFTVSTGANAFFIKFNVGKTIDDNAGKGFISLVYKDQKPVQGAYAGHAYILFSGMGTVLAKITRNVDEAAVLYRKEFELYPQSQKTYEQQYYAALSQNPANAELIAKKVTELMKSSEEKDLIFATSLLRNSGKAADADSLTKTVKTRFPSGALALRDVMNEISKEKDLVKKQAMFNDVIAKHPDLPAASKDNLILNLLTAYLQNKDMDNYNKYSAQLSNKQFLPQALNSVAWKWAVAGENLADAEKLSKQSVDITLSAAGVVSPDALTKANAGVYPMFGDTYAYIQWKMGKFSEAATNQAYVYAVADDNREVVEHYVQMLNSDKQFDKALQIAEKSIRAGVSSGVLDEELKTAYVGAKRGTAGFDAYWADVQKNNLSKKEQEKKEFEAEQAAVLAAQNSEATKKQLATVKQNLSSKIIKEPAPLFTLKDLSGKTVSLAGLKGKTVIIDFWATWCGPCIMSFPGMQIAQKKYKNNPDVVFLFIDTWENGSDYLPGVKKFIADKGYSFHVLVDETGTDKKQSKVISTYKVDGIPTKFIIDKNGDIRFKYIGYSGSTEAVVNEVTAMIELLDDPIAKTKIAAPGTSATGGTAPPPPSVNK